VSFFLYGMLVNLNTEQQTMIWLPILYSNAAQCNYISCCCLLLFTHGPAFPCTTPRRVINIRGYYFLDWLVNDARTPITSDPDFKNSSNHPLAANITEMASSMRLCFLRRRRRSLREKLYSTLHEPTTQLLDLHARQ
jgi:hypothetical protein